MRPLISVGVLLLALVAAGCGGDEEPSDQSGDGTTSDSASADPETEPTETSEPTEPEATGACDLADEGDVAAAFGQQVPAGSQGGGGHDEDGLVWQSDNCNWEVDDALEVTLAISVADDFADGSLLCPELSYLDTEATPVPEVGDRASWVGNDLGEIEGTLRVCTADRLVDIDADAPTGSRDLDTLRDQAVALATVVLGNLG